MSSSLSKTALALAAFAALLLAGCSKSGSAPSVTSPSAEVAKPAGPPEIVAAKTAFWPMYTEAHRWATDVVVLRVTAKEAPGFRNQDGKAAVWEAAFGSPSLQKYRLFTYSITDIPPSTFKGVEGGLAMPWGGISRNAMPVDTSQFNIDSDEAYRAAASDAAPWLKKNPGKGLTALEIGNTYKFQVPVWYVTWGNKQSGYVALVDASSGKVLPHK